MVVYIHDGGSPAVLDGLSVAGRPAVAAPALVAATGQRHRPARRSGVRAAAGALTHRSAVAATVLSGPAHSARGPRDVDGAPHPHATDRPRPAAGGSAG
ncbi:MULTISPECIES: hypothetical protein [unclassified Micromonospora]|uniref:hypothetical protein n=1 Tax=unclassified Micromonospora TaxID=2617518 RepID=UPI003316FBC3